MQYKMVKYSIKEIMEYTFKIIGEYIYMLGQLQKQFKSFGDYDLAKIVRTERLAIIRNLDSPNRFANFLDSWIDWGCPQTQDDNFKYFGGDVDGDGKMDVLDKAHWWRQPKSLDGDPIWEGFRFQFTKPGGADMFAYDFDGDGDNDIFTAAAAHGYGLTWFEQADSESGKKIWKRHVITGSKAEDNEFGVMFSQAHSAQLVDMDGDGIKDLITGKRWWAHNGNDPGGNDPAVLYWFKIIPGGKSGEAKFIPYQIDNDSGVGTQFLVKDITGDNKPDIIVSNKKGTFLHIQEGMTEQSPGPSK